MLEDALLYLTNRGDTVVDPFLGKAQVDSALSSLAPQIRTILDSYGVPVAWEASADQ
jgi:hypothetical protein